MAGDLNGHMGTERTRYERWHGGKTVGERNDEGEKILETAQMYDLALVNTFFQKRDEHLITYRSGRYFSTIDFILVRRSMMGRVKNSTVIPGESIATQHRILVADMSVKKQKEKRRERPERIRWWKLKETEGEQLVQKLRENIIEKLENEEAT